MNKMYVERAYGRVNLIGEHTDYNGGWVLPTSIPQFTEVTLKKREDKKVIIHSSGSREHSFELGKETHTGQWVDYLQGATKLLRESGQNFSGFEASIHSTMPEGSGLSSSAALEISFMKVICTAFQLKLSPVAMARLGQRIENEFVGARVGIMDQMACSLATIGEALFLDTYNLTYENIKLPLDKMDLLIINSGISHRLSAGGGYNERRAQCEQACKILGIKHLRDITPEELQKKELPELLMKRARHVVTENARVHQAVSAIKEGNLPRLGELFYASHKSMRDDYEVSIPEIDLLVELCSQDKNTFGARLTGGGFGGSIVAITKKGEAARIGHAVVNEYQKRTGEKGTILA